MSIYHEGERPSINVVELLNVVKFMQCLSYTTLLSKVPIPFILDRSKEISNAFGHSPDDTPVIIRAHNESHRLPTTLLALSLCVQSNKKIRPIVINNASSDETKEVAEFLGAEVVDEPIKGFGFASRRVFQHVKDEGIIQFVIMDADSIPMRSSVQHLVSILSKLSSGEVFGLRAYFGGQFLSDQILTLANITNDIRFSLHKKVRVHGGNAAIKLDESGKIIKSLVNINPEQAFGIDKLTKQIIISNKGEVQLSFDLKGIVFTDSNRFPNLRSVLRLALQREKALKIAYKDWADEPEQNYRASINP